MVHVAFRAGQIVGDRYRIHRVLGFGAMGSVWSARAVDSGEWYALKFMHPEVEHEPKLLRRFLQEAAATGALRHPSIVKVFGLGPAPEAAPPRAPSPIAKDVPFLVMELLRGEPLESVLARSGPLEIGTALELVRDLAAALELAHRAGIVHRDLTPGNVFLHRGPDGRVVPKILDFGVAKLTAAGAPSVTTTVGALIGSRLHEPRADPRRGRHRRPLGPLGAGVLLTAASSGAPFRGDDRDALVRAIALEPHPSAAKARAALGEGAPASPGVDAILDRCLAKSADERFPSADELARAIDRLLEAEAPTRAPIDVIDHDATSDDVELAPSPADSEAPTQLERPDALRAQAPPMARSANGRRRRAVGAALAAVVVASSAAWALRERLAPSTAVDASTERDDGRKPTAAPFTAPVSSSSSRVEASPADAPRSRPRPTQPSAQKAPTRKGARAATRRAEPRPSAKPDF